jgi:hypothetical protein
MKICWNYLLIEPEATPALPLEVSENCLDKKALAVVSFFDILLDKVAADR